MFISDEKLKFQPSQWLNNRVHFFKYMTASTAKIVLANRTLRWSTPGKLNDPYDVQFDLSAKLDKEITKKLSVEKMWRILKGDIVPEYENPVAQLLRYMGKNLPITYDRGKFELDFASAIDEGFKNVIIALPEVNAEVRQTMLKSKVLCLTENPTITPMWTHYADQGRGVVLRFRSVPFLDSPFGMAKPVRYVDEVPHLLDEELLSDMAAGIRLIDPAVANDRMVFTKGSPWSYEREWRICAGLGRKIDDQYEDLKFHDLELDGIIFGISTSDSDEKEIAELQVQYSNVEMFRAIKSPHSLSHEIRSL